MSSKRIKISFKTINGGNYKNIKKSDIDETNQRVKTEMKAVNRVYTSKAARSLKRIQSLVVVH